MDAPIAAREPPGESACDDEIRLGRERVEDIARHQPSPNEKGPGANRGL
jgi:hypothetical protein